ncbi:RNA polymerase subunit sigma [Bacillus cereus]|nr:RNA polymerase subunit sigma [Bacillus cereus]
MKAVLQEIEGAPRVNEIELKKWLQQMVTGDQRAFQYIYDATCKDVYRTVAFLIVDKQDIDDVVNEVYIHMWKSLSNYDYNRSFRFWLHGLIVRQVKDWRRKTWRRFRILERKKAFRQEPFYITDEGVLHMETRSELLELVNTLSYKHREVVIMRYFHEYSLDEITLLIGIPVGTVKSRLYTALKILRKEMENLSIGKENQVNGF